MTHTRNATIKERPDWIRMWVGCAIFLGVSGFIFDLLHTFKNSHNEPGMGVQAVVYTGVLFAVFLLVKAVIAKQRILHAVLALLAVCVASLTLDHFVYVSTQSATNGIAQTQSQL
ncbi:MAG TPA: hypothetical protein EYN91_11025 [Candidatus Melainabacteria bacterium]|nr:hypothetical protein [Candidatus Melainabacteria bacterium]HIN67487.1 hypothetical protein [Candidatus Obscuribacterales bacterium]